MKKHLLAIFISSVIILITVFNIPNMVEKYHYTKAYQHYEKAEYQQAADYCYDYLTRTKNIKNSDRFYGLREYCRAHLAVEAGDYIDANTHLTVAHKIYGIDYFEREFEHTVTEKYKELKPIEDAKEAARLEAAYQKQVAEGVPFIGMREEDIDKTTLGRHFESWSTSHMTPWNPIIGNVRVSGTTYAFSREDGATIFGPTVCTAK